VTKRRTLLLIVIVAVVCALAGVVTALYRAGKFASRPRVGAGKAFLLPLGQRVALDNVTPRTRLLPIDAGVLQYVQENGIRVTF